MDKEFSKDYEEHLRTVHVALVFVCVAAIIVSVAPGRPDVSAARQQLDEIWAITADWNPSFLQVADPKTEPDLLPDGPRELTFHGQSVSTLFQTAQPVAFVTLDHPPDKTNWRTNCDIDTPAQAGGRGNLNPRRVADVIPQPTTLRDFQRLWDSLLDGATLHEPEWDGDAYTIRSGASKTTLEVVQQRALATVEGKHVVTRRLVTQCLVPSTVEAIRKTGSSVTAHYQLHGRIGRDEFYFPIYLQDSGIDGQALLFRSKSQTWHHGYFKDSFRELGSSARGLEDRPWNELVKALAEEEIRSPSESLEAFGMKIPAGLSLYGALAMIVCIQWYLWVHLYEKRARRGQPATDGAKVAWVGAYTSLPARTLVVVSVVCLPVAAVVAVGTRALLAHGQHWYSWLILVGGGILSMALSVACCRLIPASRASEIAAER